MIPRGAPYIGWSDLLAAALHCLDPRSPRAAQRDVEAFWASNTVACLSVRTGLDAMLQVLAFPAGSEVVVSAITIPHILDILAKHELVAVPVDLDLDTLSVGASALRAVITGKTKAILVAHLFGSRMPMDDIVRVARDAGVMLLEDCAQANDGSGYRGHDDSDVTMFSFGSIKRQTALGGGLLRFNDPALADKVRAMVESYPRQSRLSYFKRVLTMVFIKSVASYPVFQLFVALCRLARKDHDETLGTALRGFRHGDLFARLRHQPSAPMLRVLGRRLRQSLDVPIAERVAVVQAVTREFVELPRPGSGASHHTHWLFPVMTPEPERLKLHLWAKGFDATAGASNLLSVPAPEGRHVAENAERFMREVLYLPLYPDATTTQMRSLARVLRDFDPA
ncbi:MAG: DegT/DnrJ/EryC1/StrS family aminotransferase [Gemmatimonadaceae bacterium]